MLQVLWEIWSLIADAKEGSEQWVSNPEVSTSKTNLMKSNRITYTKGQGQKSLKELKELDKSEWIGKHIWKEEQKTFEFHINVIPTRELFQVCYGMIMFVSFCNVRIYWVKTNWKGFAGSDLSSKPAFFLYSCLLAYGAQKRPERQCIWEMKIIKHLEVQLRSGWSQWEALCMLSVSTKSVKVLLLLLLGYRFERSFNIEFNYRGKVQHLGREGFQRCSCINRRSRDINGQLATWAVCIKRHQVELKPLRQSEFLYYQFLHT